jgi:Zn finger protein HypA/HybF involved in hydrogenase expression
VNRILAVLAALSIATVALAAAAPAEPVKIPNKNGEITFNHSKHKDLKCTTCHANDAGGKIAFTKESGHKTCQDCHKANKDKGALVTCKSCHSGAKS